MGLSKEHIKAGWHEVETAGEQFVAERFHSRPGASASTIRVVSDSQKGLNDQVKLRQSQLEGADEEQKVVITNDGTLVTDAQHEALKADGTSVSGAKKVSKVVPNEDEAKQVAGAQKGLKGFDPTAGSVNAPQVPSDAADQGLSAAAVSASETGSGSADTSTEPTAQAQPASFPAPEGALAPGEAGEAKVARVGAGRSARKASRSKQSGKGKAKAKTAKPRSRKA